MRPLIDYQIKNMENASFEALSPNESVKVTRKERRRRFSESMNFEVQSLKGKQTDLAPDLLSDLRIDLVPTAWNFDQTLALL